MTGQTYWEVSHWKSIFYSLKRPISDFKFPSAKMRKLAMLKQFAFFNASRNLKFFPKWLKVARKKTFSISLRFKCVCPGIDDVSHWRFYKLVLLKEKTNKNLNWASLSTWGKPKGAEVGILVRKRRAESEKQTPAFLLRVTTRWVGSADASVCADRFL